MYSVVILGRLPVVLNQRICFHLIVSWLPRIDGPVSKVGITFLQILYQILPVMQIALVRNLWHANLADPDWRSVFVEEVGPVVLHVASKGFIAALPIGTQRAPARPAIHMRGRDEPPRDRKLDRP
jgi:hypothetical protein